MLDLAGVGIEHGFLVQSRNVGCWTLFHCLCCKMDTHAVPNSSQQPFLANSSLVVTHILSKYYVSDSNLIMLYFHKQTDPSEIAILQQNERFSQVYKIILPWIGTSGPSSPRNFPGITLQPWHFLNFAINKACTNFQIKVHKLIKQWPQSSSSCPVTWKKKKRRWKKESTRLLSSNMPLCKFWKRVSARKETLFSCMRSSIFLKKRWSWLLFFFTRLLAEKEPVLEKKLQSLSLKNQVTPPSTPTKRGSFSFMSPTKVSPCILSFMISNFIPVSSSFRSFLLLLKCPLDELLTLQMTIFYSILTLTLWIPRATHSKLPTLKTEVCWLVLKKTVSIATNFVSPMRASLDSSRDEGISIPRRQPERFDDDGALAKSLPMRVPGLSAYRSQDIDIEDDKVSFVCFLLL